MPAQLIAHLRQDAPTLVRLARGTTLSIGRDAGCDLRLADASVSRRHAELREEGGRWWISDHDSRNGTFVQERRVASAELGGDDWIRLGDIYCEFRVLTDAQAADAARRDVDRRTRATALTAGWPVQAPGTPVLDACLRAAVELAHCDRGLLLLSHGDGLVVAARLGDAHRSGAQGGSRGAVEDTLRTGRPVIVNDVRTLPWLGARASVVAERLSAIVCLPLVDAGRVLGVLYADRERAGPLVDRLDLALLEAFAERAALYLATRALGEPIALDALPGWPAAQ